MNYRAIFVRLGKILSLSAAFYFFPALVALCYKEYFSIVCFLIAAAISFSIGFVLMRLKKEEDNLRTKEGLVIVGLSWIALSAIGALPLLFGGVLTNYVDCFFEMVSGFTTTGSSVLTNFDIAKSMHFWRAFSHWLGGMGILVFMLAVLPSKDAGDFQLMKFEAPGPQVGKLVSKVRFTATILYVIYFAFTLIEFVFLLCGGTDVYNAIVISLSTAGTGGFAATSDSLAAFDSAYVDIVVTVFMFLFSVNFNLYYLLLLKKFSAALKDEELRFYVCYLVFAILSITVCNTCFNSAYKGKFFTALRYSAFAVVSCSSTTGFITADFTLWPMFTQCILLLTIFFGGMAGSTGGGLKACRVLILAKSGKADAFKVLRPREVEVVKFNKKPLTAEFIASVRNYFFLAIASIVCSTLLLSLECSDFTTAFTAVVTCFSNVGPGLGNVVGPVGSFAPLGSFSKIVLSFDMLLGRLEIFPVLMLFSKKTWSKRY